MGGSHIRRHRRGTSRQTRIRSKLREHPDLDQLSENLRAASIRATLIDETFGRTLRVEHPDDPSTAAEIWINEPQTDLYGYRQGLPTAR